MTITGLDGCDERGNLAPVVALCDRGGACPHAAAVRTPRHHAARCGGTVVHADQAVGESTSSKKQVPTEQGTTKGILLPCAPAGQHASTGGIA